MNFSGNCVMASALTCLLCGLATDARSQMDVEISNSGWRQFNGDHVATRSSPLKQIDKTNVASLAEVARSRLL